jgi:hypothetical protein
MWEQSWLCAQDLGVGAVLALRAVSHDHLAQDLARKA